MSRTKKEMKTYWTQIDVSGYMNLIIKAETGEDAREIAEQIAEDPMDYIPSKLCPEKEGAEMVDLRDAESEGELVEFEEYKDTPDEEPAA